MKTLRALTSILIIGFVFSLCSCFLDIHNATTPDLQLKYTLDLGDDILNFIVPFESGYICCVNSNEMRIVDREGNTKNIWIFDNGITDIYSEDYGRIMVSLDNNEVLLFHYKDNLLEENVTVQFDEPVSDISVFWWLGDYDTCFVVLDNGDLYAYGDNYNHILDPDRNETEFIDEPHFLLSGVEYICSRYAITSEEIVVFGENEIPLSIDNIEGITNCFGFKAIYTDNGIYRIENEGIVKVHDIDQESFHCMQDGYIYSSANRVFYTGMLSAPAKGKGLPIADNEEIDLTINGNCCVITNGILLYDEHTITCYWV